MVFIQILEYFLIRYSQVIADFFHGQVQLISGCQDALTFLKPVADGGAASFLSLVMKVFNNCFKYQSPITVSQFFDSNSREATSDAMVSHKSQLVIDILTYGLTYLSQHLAAIGAPSPTGENITVQ